MSLTERVKKIPTADDNPMKTIASLLTKAKDNHTKKIEKPKVNKTKVVPPQVCLRMYVTLVAFGVNKTYTKNEMKTFLVEKGIYVVDVSDITLK